MIREVRKPAIQKITKKSPKQTGQLHHNQINSNELFSRIYKFFLQLLSKKVTKKKVQNEPGQLHRNQINFKPIVGSF